MRLSGIVAATVLPMRDDGSIDEPALRRYVGWLLEQGVHGLAVNVDTGEGPHLYPEERTRVVEVVRQEVRGRVPIVAGLPASFTQQAAAWAREAGRAGADAVLVFPHPAFRGRPLPPGIPVRYHRAVAAAAGVPLVVFQLQDALGGVEYPPEVLQELLALDEVIAVKEASFDARKFTDTAALVRRVSGRVSLLTGNDNFIYESFVLGAEGALIGFGTVAVEQQVKMFAAVQRKDYSTAARIWDTLRELVELIFAPPVRDYRARLKEALVLQGVIPGATVREPLAGIGPQERKRIRETLVGAGIPVVS